MSALGRLAALRAAIGLFTLLLCGITFPLWRFDPTGLQIPWLGALRFAPAWVDGLGLGVWGLGSVGMILFPQSRKTWIFSGLAAIGAAIAVSLDQQRLQPWVWQFWIMCVLLTLAPNNAGLSCSRAM